MTRDESLRGAERRSALTGPASDLAALERLAIERQRAEDPLTKLRALVKRAQDLRRDVHFELDDLAKHFRYAMGPDRNAAMPLWEDVTVIRGRAHR